MKFNSCEIREASMQPGNQEGVLLHRPPSKTFESALKERWFKLKGNLLFYYRLNGEGVVEKNEPSGVFVLENFKVEREKLDFKHPFGFSITWKDDLYRKHCFYTRAENVLQNWISNIFQASYEMLRAELLVLRLKIRNKSGKDPLEHLGLPLQIHSIRGVFALPSKALPLCRSTSSSHLSMSANRDEGKLSVVQPSKVIRSAPSSPLNIKVQQPKAPPRTNRAKKKNAYCDSQDDVAQRNGSFKCHLYKESNDVVTSGLKEISIHPSGSFKSHLTDTLTGDQLNWFLK